MSFFTFHSSIKKTIKKLTEKFQSDNAIFESIVDGKKGKEL